MTQTFRFERFLYIFFCRIDPEVQEGDPEGNQRQYRGGDQGYRRQGPGGKALEVHHLRQNGKIP